MAPFDVGDLIRRCVAGDAEAQASFCAEYLPVIERAVAWKYKRYTGEPPVRSEVEDVRNDIMERLLARECAALRQLRSPRSIDAWLLTVAQNAVLDQLRKDSKRRRALEAVAKETPKRYEGAADRGALRSEASERLTTGLRALSAPDRLVVELFYIHGLSYAEMADMLGENINTLSARLRRARVILKQLLDDAL